MGYSIVLNKEPKVIFLPVTYTKKVAGVRIIGYDYSFPATVFFDRQIPGRKSQKEIYEIPLPFAPEKLGIKVLSDGSSEGIIINEPVPFKPLVIKNAVVLPEMKSFIGFASDVALNLRKMVKGYWTSEDGRWLIKIDDKVKNRVTGKEEDTPISVSVNSGHLEASIRELKKHTVPGIFVLLAHEFGHYFLKTADEFACDKFAAELALNLGFSQTEILYAFSKTFKTMKPNLDAGLRIERENRIVAIKDFIQNWT
ncbi:hypothetical protein DDD_0706 [Sporocytophaga myxococcoides]|uniref:Uncharacterized protein n=1 Tax=Sporocytophaga myxococcoides TaxID=153721 RepID=A0A098LB63_9BACT|nr:hypothetical protein [Sporocytophaga myxococcoides]GAL83423.1 hypothetical protein DDD_0706 [Sporocytophaga myxococcoides]